MEFIKTLEDCLGKKIEKNYLPLQAGDVPATYADIDDLARDVGFKPQTPIVDGIREFVEWYKDYYNVCDINPYDQIVCSKDKTDDKK